MYDNEKMSIKSENMGENSQLVIKSPDGTYKYGTLSLLFTFEKIATKGEK